MEKTLDQARPRPAEDPRHAARAMLESAGLRSEPTIVACLAHDDETIAAAIALARSQKLGPGAIPRLIGDGSARREVSRRRADTERKARHAHAAEFMAADPEQAAAAVAEFRASTGARFGHVADASLRRSGPFLDFVHSRITHQTANPERP